MMRLSSFSLFQDKGKLNVNKQQTMAAYICGCFIHSFIFDTPTNLQLKATTSRHKHPAETTCRCFPPSGLSGQ